MALISGTGTIDTVPTGTLDRRQLDRLVRLSQASTPPNVKFSGFLRNDLQDGTVIGRSLVIDDEDDPGDLPEAVGFAIITLENVSVAPESSHPTLPSYSGTLVLEQRARQTGFINSTQGITSSFQYRVVEGRDGLAFITGGAGMGVGFTSMHPSNQRSTGKYWLQLEY